MGSADVVAGFSGVGGTRWSNADDTNGPGTEGSTYGAARCGAVYLRR